VANDTTRRVSRDNRKRVWLLAPGRVGDTKSRRYFCGVTRKNVVDIFAIGKTKIVVYAVGRPAGATWRENVRKFGERYTETP